jgi:RNA polymerase sigma factor for flagellar operon FliA
VEAINGLPEEERLVIALYYFEEFKLTQIGIIMGKSESLVSRIYASGVFNLRARLGDQVHSRRPVDEEPYIS